MVKKWNVKKMKCKEFDEKSVQYFLVSNIYYYYYTIGLAKKSVQFFC